MYHVIAYYYDQTGQRIVADKDGKPFATDIESPFRASAYTTLIASVES